MIIIEFENIDYNNIIMTSDFWIQDIDGKVTNACYLDPISKNYYLGTLQSKCHNDYVRYNFFTKQLSTFKITYKNNKRIIDFCFPKKHKIRVKK